MGRRKLSIRRLQSSRERQTKYSQRKEGIVRKSKDLSVLCDTDVMLLMFSPSGKPCLAVGQDKNLLTVVDRLANLPVDYREERTKYTMELLAKMHGRIDSDVDPKSFSLDSDEILQRKRAELAELKRQLAEKAKALREWKFPSTVDAVGEIQRMENSLSELMARVTEKKREFQEQEQRGEEERRNFEALESGIPNQLLIQEQGQNHQAFQQLQN